MYPWAQFHPTLHKLLSNSLKLNQYLLSTTIQHNTYNQFNNTEKAKQYNNIWIHGSTGTGKTLAYLIPIVNKLLYQNSNHQNIYNNTIIVLPHTSLIQQVQYVINKLCHNIQVEDHNQHISCQIIDNNTTRINSSILLGKPIDIHSLITTTGTASVPYDISALEHIVIDEADQQLIPKSQYGDYSSELLHYSDDSITSNLLTHILQHNNTIQSIFVSATISDSVLHRLDKHGYYGERSITQINNCVDQPTGILQQSRDQVHTPAALQHCVYYTDTNNSRSESDNLYAGSDTRDACIAIQQLMKQQCGHALYLCLDATLHSTERELDLLNVEYNMLSDELNNINELYAQLHSSSSNNLLLLGSVNTVRGLDLPNISTVYIGVPMSIITQHTYMHAAGRVARAGQHGTSILLIKQYDKFRLNQLSKQCNITFEQMN